MDSLLFIGNLFLLLSSSLLLTEKFIPSSSFAAKGILCFLLMVLFISIETLILGLFGYLNKNMISLGTMIIAIAVSLKYSKVTVLYNFRTISFFFSSLPLVLNILTVFFVAVLAWHAYLNTLLPIHVWDVLVYHMPNVAEWVTHSRIFEIHTWVDRSHYMPMGFETILTWVGVFFHHDLQLRFVEYTFGLIGSVVCYDFCRLLMDGKHRNFAFFLAITFFLTPAILIQILATRNDLSTNILYLTTLLFMARTIVSKDSRYLAIATLSAGLALNFKPIALVFLTLFYTTFAIAMLIQWGFRTALIRVALSGIACLFIGSPWYLKNWIIYGHPIEAIQNAGSRHMVSLFNFSDFSTHFWSVWYKLLDRGTPFSSDLTGSSGFGPIFFGFFFTMGCLLLCYRFIGEGKEKGKKGDLLAPLWITATAFLGIFIIIQYLSHDNPWNFRYFSWISIVPFLLMGFLVSKNQISKLNCIPFLVFSSIYGFMTSYTSGDTSDGVVSHMKSKAMFERSSAMSARFMPDPHRYVGYFVPTKFPIGYRGANGADWFVYPLYGTWFSRQVHHCHEANNLQELKNCLSKNGVKFAIIADSLAPEVRASKNFIEIRPFVFYWREG